MIEACQYCSNPANRAEVAELISQRSFTGAATRYIQPGILGSYNYGGFDQRPRLVNSPETTLFFDLPSTLSTVPHDHSTFLWQSQCLWLMTQATRWGQIAEWPKNADQIARQAWRTDLYRDIATEMGIQCPTEDYKLEPETAFIDGKPFDPSDPIGYLKSFEIRARAPQLFFLA
jgi:nitrate/nitrite transport system substrate-binding protein